MEISIALCTYNGTKFLAEQLESFLQQTHLPDELIVCDDRSTDQTVEILKSFARKAPFPVYIHVNENNLGSTKNFEKAISLCQGRVIFLSDQDDVWHKDKLRKFINEFASDETVGLVFCDGELVDENLNSLGVNAWKACSFDKRQQKWMESGNGLPRILKSNVVTGCMMAFRAEYKPLFLPIPNDVPTVIHDYWIALVIMAVTKVKLIPDKLVKYRQHSQQQLGLSLENKEVLTIWERTSSKFNFQTHLSKLQGLKKCFNEQCKFYLEENKNNKPSILREIDTQIQHYQVRTQISKSKKLCIYMILRELLSLRYHHYSNGWRSAAKDLSLYFID